MNMSPENVAELVGSSTTEPVVGTATEAVVGSSTTEPVVGTATEAVVESATTEPVVGSAAEPVVGNTTGPVVGSGEELKPKNEEDILTDMFVGIGSWMEHRDRTSDEIGMLSRAICYESKRCVAQVIGFFQKPKALVHAWQNLKNVISNNKFFRGLAHKLCLNEQFEYLALRRFSPGIEEFIEAMALLIFFREGRLIEFHEIRRLLNLKLRIPCAEYDVAKRGLKEGSTIEGEEVVISYQIPISKTIYYQGIADITGELVRACAVGFDSDHFKHFLFSSRALVQSIYKGLSLLQYCPRQLRDKLSVMESSLIKLDTACYFATMQMERFKYVIASDFFRKPAVSVTAEIEDVESEDILK